MKSFFKTFYSKVYVDFDSSHLEFRKRILKSIQISFSIFLIVFMLSIYPFQKVPITYYIYLPALLAGNNIFSCCLLRVRKFERLITFYICILQLGIPAVSLELSISILNIIGGIRALFIGLQVGLMYSISFLTLSSSLHKFWMTIFFIFHIVSKEYMLGHENIFGTTFVIIGILVFVNYVYYRKEMLNLGIWTTLLKRNEGLQHFEKLIEIFPSQIVVLNKLSLETDSALYFNIDAQKLREEVLPRNESLSVFQFLDRFEILEGNYEETMSVSKGAKSLKTIIKDSCSREEVLGNDFHTFVSSLRTDKSEAIIINNEIVEPTMSSKKDFTKEQIAQKWEIKLGKIEWGQQEALIIIFNDISKAEKIRELKTLDQNKDKLLATVSHELRTPLNGIIGMIDVSHEDLEESPEKVRTYLEVAKNSAKNLLLMINDILDISQIRKGNLRLTLEWTNLAEIIEKVLPLINVQVKSKQLEFLYENKCPEETLVFSDPLRFQQILMNLLGNACKFTTNGFVKLTAKLKRLKLDEHLGKQKYRKQSSDNRSLTFDLKEELLNLQSDEEEQYADFVELRVEDTGRGIKEEEKPSLFQLFGKLETESNTTGVGLGLAISQSLVKKMNSDGIQVETWYGKGSIFSFSLKASIGYNDYFSEQKYQIPEEKPSIQKTKLFRGFNEKILPLTASNTLRVLVVDDDETNQLVIGLYLKALAQNIISDKAYNGEEALKLVEKNSEMCTYYNLILMDCDMPVMNGFQATEKLQELVKEGKLPEVKIVAITANASVADREFCLKQGMIDIWVKPITRMEFIKKFNDVVN